MYVEKYKYYLLMTRKWLLMSMLVHRGVTNLPLKAHSSCMGLIMC